MKIQPLGDMVLIEQEGTKEKSRGGIVLPNVAKHKPSRGRVIAVGPGKILENGDHRKLEVKKGDKVMFAPEGHVQEVELDRKTFLLINQLSITAIVKE